MRWKFSSDCDLNCDFLWPQIALSTGLTSSSLSDLIKMSFSIIKFSHTFMLEKVANDKHTRSCQINLWIILRLLERQFFGLNFHVYFPQNCHFYLDTETWDNEGVSQWSLMGHVSHRDKTWTLLNIFLIKTQFSNVSIKFFNFLIKSSD